MKNRFVSDPTVTTKPLLAYATTRIHSDVHKHATINGKSYHIAGISAEICGFLKKKPNISCKIQLYFLLLSPIYIN